MGLSSSSDAYCGQSDLAKEGMQFSKKLVDNILVWVDSMPQLLEQVKMNAERCNQLNIILSRKKFVIGKELPFAGLAVSETRALSDFHIPKDVTSVL